MNIFLALSKDVTYKKIVDRIGSEHQLSPNLKRIDHFTDAMSANIPDMIIVDKNLDYFDNIMNLDDTIRIIVFEGSFPVLMDQLSDHMLESQVQTLSVKGDEEAVHPEPSPAKQTTIPPFLRKLSQSKPGTTEELDLRSDTQELQPPSKNKLRNDEAYTKSIINNAADAIQDNEPEWTRINSENTSLSGPDAPTITEEQQEIASIPVNRTKRTDVFQKSSLDPVLKKRYLNQVVAVWSPVGGSGKTEIAKNLALHLAKSMRVVLIDGNLSNPDIGDHLGIGFPEGKTLYEAYQAYLNHELTIEVLERIFIDHYGIKVLVGIPDVITQSDLSELFFITLLKTIRTVSDVVILDLNNDLTGPAGVQIFSYCDQVIVPVTTCSSSLVHTKAYVNLFKQGNISLDKCEFVVNRFGEGGQVDKKLVASTLEKKPIGVLPYSQKHIRSADQGKPLYLASYGPIVQLCETLGNPYIEAIKSIENNITVPEKKQSFFQKLFGKLLNRKKVLHERESL